MEKFKSFMGKLKKHSLVFIIVWLIGAILFVVPVTYTITQAHLNGRDPINYLIIHLMDNFMKFPIAEVFTETYVNDFINGMKYYTLIYMIIIIVSIYKTLPKGDFHDIEHGSSDWCEPGEQYKVLSKKEGLLLAKDNYLPLTKPGNHNVLIVGRIRCW